MATVVSTRTRERALPYITISEMKNAPTRVDLTNLIPGGSQPTQDAELANLILRASGAIDNFLDQQLVSRVRTEVARPRINRRGEVFIHPDHTPIVELRSFKYGATPANLGAVDDLSNVQIDEHYFTIVLGPFVGGSSEGSLEFGRTLGPDQPLFCEFTYVNGWPVTGLAADVALGGAQITVKDSAGIIAGDRLAIYNSDKTEDVVVQSVTGNVVTLTAGTASAHTAGTGALAVGISAMPAQVKEAAILITTALLKVGGNGAIVSGQLRASQKKHKDEVVDPDIQMAGDLLSSFRRVI